MTQYGVVESVETVNDGGFLTSDHAAGSTVLNVDNTDVFETATLSGQVQVNDVAYTYTSVDTDASTITLDGSGLTAGADLNDAVFAYPLSPVKIAYVVLGDSIGDAMSVRIPHFLAAYVALADGPRASLVGQAVEVDTRNGELVLYDVLGLPAVINPAAIPSTGGDIDPDDVVFIDGPPDSYYHSSSTGYMDYATAVTFAGSTFVDAVAAIVADDGHIEVTGNTIAAVGGATHRVYPTWHIPTNGKQCRVVMDAPTVGTGTGSQDLTFEVHAEQDLSTYSSSLVDNYLYSFDFDSAPNGMSARIWYDHVGLFGDVETSLPAGAIGTALTSDFQLSPQVSLTPSEAGVSDPAAPYIVISLEYPVASWGGSGSNTSQSFVINNLRVIRE